MKIFLLFLLHLIALVSFGQPIFQRNYAGFYTLFGDAKAGIQTDDGGYAITGETNDFPMPAVTNVMLIKTNHIGDTTWVRNFDGSNSEAELGLDVKQTTDMGYIISGWTQSFGSGEQDVLLLKTDSLGNCMWAKAYGTSIPEEVGNYVAQTPDNGYIVAAGFPHNYGSGTTLDKASIMKTDSLGNMEWSNSYTGINSACGNSIVQTDDGGYILIGRIMNVSGGDVFLAKTDSLGNTLWMKSIDVGGSFDDFAYSAVKTVDNGIVITGKTGVSPNYNVFILKADSIGNPVWSRNYGRSGYDEGNAIKEVSSGGYIVAGSSFGTSNTDVYLLRTDANGAMDWERTFGYSAGFDYGWSVGETSDNGFMITGLFGTSSAKAYFIKTDINGHSAGCWEAIPVSSTMILAPSLVSVSATISSAFVEAPGVITTQYKGNRYTECFNSGTVETIGQSMSEEIVLYPNPSSTKISISSSGQIESYEVMSLQGQLLLVGKGAECELGTLAKGFYLLRVKSNLGNSTFRFIKE